MKIRIKRLTAHSRSLRVEDERGVVIEEKVTNNMDRFNPKVIDELRTLVEEMEEHNYNMDIRDEERK